MKRKIELLALLGLAVALACLGYLRHRDNATAANLDAMAAYLRQIETPLIGNLKEWATAHNWPAWLCGPTSYALAREMDDRFFGGELPITGTPSSGDCIVIVAGVVRIPEGGGACRLEDHAWIEIHWRGLRVFVDPTYSQFDHQGSIPFAWFNEKNDPKYAEWLQLLRLGRATGADFDDAAMNALVGDVDYIGRSLDAGMPPRDWCIWSRRLQREVFHGMVGYPPEDGENTVKFGPTVSDTVPSNFVRLSMSRYISELEELRIGFPSRKSRVRISSPAPVKAHE